MLALTITQNLIKLLKLTDVDCHILGHIAGDCHIIGHIVGDCHIIGECHSAG